MASSATAVTTKKRVVKIAISVDFDAVSGWLGTGHHPENNMSDHSAGIFAGKVGAPRLLKLFKKLGIADRTTWFIPGHSIESFPSEVAAIVEAGCEIGLHGYSHEDPKRLTVEQESDVFNKCIALAKGLTGKRPVGYRAPMYRICERTVDLLEKNNFLYDTSLSHHDSVPYFLPRPDIITPPDYTRAASTWMKPLELMNVKSSKIIEIPANWYMEDMTPMQYFPHTENSHGYVDVRNIENMWKDRFNWLWENGSEGDGPTDFVFPLVMHPDTSGMAHIIGMIERFIVWLREQGDEVEFHSYESIALGFVKLSHRTLA